MNLNLFLTATFFGAFFLVSCSDDDGNNTALGSYNQGVLIVNEGDFSAGTITYVSRDFSIVSQDIYGAVNGGDGIGSYVQSLFFDGDKAYIISNGSNKITVVNRYTFELIDKIETGFSVPRYGVVIGNKAYVTNLADFVDETDDFVSIIDLTTNQVTDAIPVNAIAERIAENDGKLYIANGSYGSGSSVTVIEAATKAVVATIDTGLAPSALAAEDGVLYILCGNYGTAGKLLRVNLQNNQLLSELAFPENVTNPQNLEIEDHKLYFTSDSKVFALSPNAISLSATPLFVSEALTLYGFAVQDGQIWVGDAKDYASNGTAYVYDLNGNAIGEFTTGLVPNGFYFND